VSDREGIYSAVASFAYAIPEFHRILPQSEYNSDKASCTYHVSRLLQAMSAGDNRGTGTSLTNLVHALGAKEDADAAVVDLFGRLTKENQEVEQLFRLNIETTEWPTLTQASHEERSKIVASGMPLLPFYCTNETVTLIDLEGNDIEGMMDWFEPSELYTFNDQRYSVCPKSKKVESPLPPYLLIKASSFHLDNNTERLNLSSFTKVKLPFAERERVTQYGLIAVLSQVSEKWVAYVREGEDWAEFDNGEKRQISSLKDAKGQGKLFLFENLNGNV
jgi:hypothetical protein